MSKKTYIKGVDMVIIDGEIRLLSHNQNVIYSTVPYIGVKQLDRQRFVKPVDVEQMAEQWAINNGIKGAGLLVRDESPYRTIDGVFIAGYNANKGVYTEQQLVEALEMNSRACTRKEIISYLHPLSLPESVTIENEEIIEVVW